MKYPMEKMSQKTKKHWILWSVMKMEKGAICRVAGNVSVFQEVNNKLCKVISADSGIRTSKVREIRRIAVSI